MRGRGRWPFFLLLLAAGTLEGCGGCSGTISVSFRDADADAAADGAEDPRDGRDGADVPLEEAETAAEDEAEQDAPDAMEEELCIAATCGSLGAECGEAGDGCGGTLGCGTCPGDLRCGGDGVPNRCGAPACVPASSETSNGGGRCGPNLNLAYTARGVNVGFYPYVVAAPIEQYSGDYSGDPGAVFTPGAATRGVILQIIPAGAHVGLMSSPAWYGPAADCFEGSSCGAAGRDACTDSGPPLRPGIAGFFWGYAYEPGGSHMQGWIPYDPSRLVFAGFDPAHPCALGPAGLDFEVHSACGAPTACSGGNRSCGDANKCDEGADDCGRTECGAQSGGPLTPTAHRYVAAYPAAAHACTERTPPHPSCQCLANGSDADHFVVYPFGAYIYNAQDSTTKAWLHYGDTVQSYFHTRDGAGVLWEFIEVLTSGASTLTPPSDGAGGNPPCASDNVGACTPCVHGGTCGWIQNVFLQSL